ncbi:MAG: hypothetical protein L6R40_007931 [Gallowayella cf. fulva]|nr:MAG: hypothetical protein L6R40_007931 [Xanthomendoza cf. fulva]
MYNPTDKPPADASSSLSTPPPESPIHSTTHSSSDFDILKTYTHLLSTHPTLTPPLAAITSLITLLSTHPPSTTSETLSLLSHHSSILKSSVANPIPLSAGTELFQRYIVGTLQSSPSSSTADFQTTRNQLLENGRAFVESAKEARGVIAQTARRFVRDGATVLTSGTSRVVRAVLNAAADDGVRFRVIYVRASSTSAPPAKDQQTTNGMMMAELRGQGIPVAVIAPEAVAYSLGKTSMVMVGAEGIAENGGIISRLGTYQLAMLAKDAGKPVYVVAESHKFVRLYPLGQYDLPIRQAVVDFSDQHEDDDDEGDAESGKGQDSGQENDEAVDFTPPELITALVTEAGVHTPSAISEELIKIGY